jgi:hypothetical protein
MYSSYWYLLQKPSHPTLKKQGEGEKKFSVLCFTPTAGPVQAPCHCLGTVFDRLERGTQNGRHSPLGAIATVTMAGRSSRSFRA